MQTKKQINEIVEEATSLVDCADDAIGNNDFQTAEEYLADAGSVLNRIEDAALRQKIAGQYLINPLDFAV